MMMRVRTLASGHLRSRPDAMLPCGIYHDNKTIKVISKDVFTEPKMKSSSFILVKCATLSNIHVRSEKQHEYVCGQVVRLIGNSCPLLSPFLLLFSFSFLFLLFAKLDGTLLGEWFGEIIIIELELWYKCMRRIIYLLVQRRSIA